MNVFVLGTGRCGTTTFAKACGHIENYTAAHESRTHLWGNERLTFPSRHIEVDNRLSWFLGLLDEQFGPQAVYVHLIRDTEKTVNSFRKKWGTGIMKAFAETVVMKNNWLPAQREQACRFYVETVNANIRQFLKDKPRQITIDIDDPIDPFQEFWRMINAQGDLQAALAEFSIAHNAS